MEYKSIVPNNRLYKKSLRLCTRRIPIIMQAYRRNSSRLHIPVEPGFAQHKSRFGSKRLEKLVPQESLVQHKYTDYHRGCAYLSLPVP